MMQLRNRYFFMSDVIFLSVASYLSYVLRLETWDLDQLWPSFWLFMGIVLLLIPVAFWKVGLYARYWRYASVDELLLLVGTVTLSTLVVGALSWLSSQFLSDAMPRSIPFIFLLLALATTAGPRFLVRFAIRYGKGKGKALKREPVLVIGAGDAGAMIVRELQNHGTSEMDVVGFLDDDPAKRNVRIYGVPVLGDRYEMGRVVGTYGISKVIIAMPSASGAVIRELVAICEEVGVETRILPGLSELVNGQVHLGQLREVNIEDLLRREPVKTNTAEIRALIEGCRVMVTGGGGSIGSELCRQIATFEPSELIIVEHSENNMFYIERELRQDFPALPLVPVIADIRNYTHLQTIYEEYRPEIVFHAAAHKHVPMMEANPCEAITNNVMGTRNLVELAEQYEVERFVLISTDKAVNPTNIMGASKRCAERIVHDVARRSGRAYVAVRFGNVLGSNGSVVPLFKKQIAAGGPVTVTDPKMQRFFMTIPEAVQLVMQAGALGEGREVFILDMGEPVRIVDLARDLITLSGLRPNIDIEVKFIGIRPGEKLYEELFIPGEQYQRTRHEKIFVVQSASVIEDDPRLWPRLERLIEAAQARNDNLIRLLLKDVVPEYQPQDLLAKEGLIVRKRLPSLNPVNGQGGGCVWLRMTTWNTDF